MEQGRIKRRAASFSRKWNLNNALVWVYLEKHAKPCTRTQTSRSAVRVKSPTKVPNTAHLKAKLTTEDLVKCGATTPVFYSLANHTRAGKNRLICSILSYTWKNLTSTETIYNKSYKSMAISFKNREKIFNKGTLRMESLSLVYLVILFCACDWDVCEWKERRKGHHYIKDDYYDHGDD